VLSKENGGLHVKISFAQSRGFFFTLPASECMDATRLPEELINFVKKAKSVTCTSLKLLSYNDRINESLTEVYLFLNLRFI
jgi:hypothetical protein